MTVSQTSGASKEQIHAAVQVLKAVADAIRELKIVPSGVLYAHLMGQMSLNEYQAIISTLERTKLIVVRNNVIHWDAPANLK